MADKEPDISLPTPSAADLQWARQQLFGQGLLGWEEGEAMILDPASYDVVTGEYDGPHMVQAMICEAGEGTPSELISRAQIVALRHVLESIGVKAVDMRPLHRGVEVRVPAGLFEVHLRRRMGERHGGALLGLENDEPPPVVATGWVSKVTPYRWQQPANEAPAEIANDTLPQAGSVLPEGLHDRLRDCMDGRARSNMTDRALQAIQQFDFLAIVKNPGDEGALDAITKECRTALELYEPIRFLIREIHDQERVLIESIGPELYFALDKQLVGYRRYDAQGEAYVERGLTSETSYKTAIEAIRHFHCLPLDNQAILSADTRRRLQDPQERETTANNMEQIASLSNLRQELSQECGRLMKLAGYDPAAVAR